MNRAIFLDRDGVINEDSEFVSKISDFKFLKNVFESLRRLQFKGFKLFIITNQSGIGRGYYSIQDFKKLNDYMLESLKSEQIEIPEVYFCPHKPEDNCECRKPNAGMIKQYHNDYSEIIGKEFLVGDTDKDYGCAENAGIPFILRKRSYNTDLVPFADYYINTLRGLGGILGK